MKRLSTLLLLVVTSLLSSAAPPPELTALRQHYDQLISDRVTTPFEAQVRELNLKFTTALERAAVDINKTGNLEAAVAVQEDIKRLADGVPMPEDDDKTPDALKRLRAIYRGQLGRLVSKRDADYARILPGYTAKLQEIESSLVKANRVEEARQTKDFRESLLLTISIPSTASTPTGPATSPNSAARVITASAAEAQTQLVDWCLNNGHAIDAQVERHRVYVTSPQELPKEKFQITKVAYVSSLPKRNPRPFSWSWLDSCPDLISLYLDFDDDTEITMEHLAHLAGLKKLEAFQIGGDSIFTGFDLQKIPVLPALTKLTLPIAIRSADTATLRQKFPKLTSITFAYTKLEPSTFSELSSWKGLSEIRLDGSSAILTAPHITALLQCKDLRTLVLYPGKSAVIDPTIKTLTQLENLWIAYDISPESFTALCGLPNVKSFAFSASTSLNDTELAQILKFPRLTELKLWNMKLVTDALIPHLTQLKDLTSMDLDGTPITDAGLQEITKIKKLRKLYVRKCAVTDAGIHAFIKKRPDVKVEH